MTERDVDLAGPKLPEASIRRWLLAAHPRRNLASRLRQIIRDERAHLLRAERADRQQPK